MTGNGLKFLLQPSAIDGEKRLTTARLAVRVDDEPVWPAAGAEDVSLEIQIDDLLSHLTEFWKPLALRQTYPIPVAPYRPMQLRVKAEERWENVPPEVAEREDALVCAFEEAHDLSHCFGGYFELAPLWLLRSGDRMIVDSCAGLRTAPFDQAWAEISRLGEEIAERLSTQAQRWSRLIERWRQRDRGDPAVLLAWATSLDRSVASALARDGVLSEPKRVVEAATDNDELRIAARMASALPDGQIRQILNIIHTFGKSEATRLHRLSELVLEHIAQHHDGKRAYEQGEAAARFMRRRLDLPSQSETDIEKILSDLGIVIERRTVQPASLDALAVWGDRFGPAVLLNMSSKRETKAAARVTLAHELCHLLLDRGHALSAVEILNSRMPPYMEQRAKSFAGELLLPYEDAAECWRLASCPDHVDGLEGVVKFLQRRFKVPKAVAAWKLEHGAQRQGVDLKAPLDEIAPDR